MSKLEKIYDKMPIFIQNLMVTLSGYQRNKSRYGKIYYEHINFLQNFDSLSLDDKLIYQQQEIVKFINYAYNHSLFYRNLYKDIDIKSIKTINDLKQLPIVDKETLRKNIKDVVTITKKGSIENHTGGTTGKSLVVLVTPEDMMKRMATLDYFKAKVGFVHLKMKRATFNGKHIVPPKQKRKIFWRYNKACKQMIYSSFHLSENNIQYYIESLNKFKPDAIDGFFTSICDVASYIERHNIKIEFQPIAIFPTSETITKIGRELIERVFKCKVYNQYASSEGAPFITECKNQRLHISLESGVFEQYDNDNHEILITSFTTHGTPLIRYRIGDSIIFEEENIKCDCGNQSPIVKEIQGRRLDFLYTAEGAKINGGNIANLFKNIPNALIRAQVIQEKLGEVKILLEADKKLYKVDYDNLIKNEFVHKFGRTTNVLIEHVNEISREKSGKFRMIVNNLNKQGAIQ